MNTWLEQFKDKWKDSVTEYSIVVMGNLRGLVYVYFKEFSDYNRNVCIPASVIPS